MVLFFPPPMQEYNKKLVKVKDVQKEIRNHLNNLPDLSQLPDVTGGLGLAPLPSAGDLFNIHSGWNNLMFNRKEIILIPTKPIVIILDYMVRLKIFESEQINFI